MTRTLRRLKLILPVSTALLVALAAVILVGAVTGVATARAAAPGGGGGAAMDCGAVSGQAAGLDPAQERNAKIIASVALGRDLGETGAAIGIAVALAESTLFNYANDGTSTLVGSAEGRQLNDAERAVARQSLDFPHDKVGDNLDSIGLFQQRPMSGWGPPKDLIDPATSAGIFFDHLLQVPGWQSLPPWNAAQTVQGSPSSDGGIYRDMYEQAVVIVAGLTSDTDTAKASPTAPSTASSTAAPATTGGSAPAAGDDEWCSPSGLRADDPAVAAPPAAGGAGGSAQWGGYSNGQIPATALCPVRTQPALLLECDAAGAFDQLNTAFKAQLGQDIGITDGYRSYDEQVACRAEKGSLCADPGTSNHGWAKAVDIGACCEVNSGTGRAFEWLTANASTYGWVHPGWAQSDGSKPEPWHWEFGSIS